MQKLPGCVTSHGSVITSPTANLKASDLVTNVGSFLFNTWLPAKAAKWVANRMIGLFEKFDVAAVVGQN